MLAGPSYDHLRWLAGPLCCGTASFVMTMTNTVYPPGGATAILAATDPTVAAMGWVFVPVVLLGSVLMLGVALVANNIQRQYPVFWWTPRHVGRRDPKHDDNDIETIAAAAAASSLDGANDEKEMRGERSLHQIVITEDRIVMPEGFILGDVDVQLFEMLRERLRDADRYYDPERGALSEAGSSGTVRSSREMLPSLKLQKSHEES